MWAELFSALYAIRFVASHYSDAVVRLVMDSKSNVDIVSAWSTKSDDISQLLRAVAVCVADANITIVAEFRRGVDNHWPDLLSRPSKHRFRSVRDLCADRVSIPVARAGDVNRVRLVSSRRLPEVSPESQTSTMLW
jgi:hypothetical protein